MGDFQILLSVDVCCLNCRKNGFVQDFYNRIKKKLYCYTDGSMGEEFACRAGDTGQEDAGQIPGSGRSSGGRKWPPTPVSGLENPMDRGD